MIKIEAITLEEAYQNAASSLECSVTELKIEVIQYPKKGLLGLFKKSAIIVATQETTNKLQQDTKSKPETKIKNEDIPKEEVKLEVKKQEVKPEQKIRAEVKKQEVKPKPKKEYKSHKKESSQRVFNDTIMPESFVSTQDEEYETDKDNSFEDSFYEDKDESQSTQTLLEIVETVKRDINKLFELTCFKIDKVEVSSYDENTLLVELKGEDAALLIGKEGYRYKALSYMIFNWINSKYQLQLRLEIAEFLKNQEESVSRYLIGVCEGIDRDGRAQTKILDGVLVQIALRELRDKYPDKYVAIRSTRDGMKYIIINDYYSN